MSATRFVFAVVLILIWIVTGGYATQANVYLTDYKRDDADLKQAWNLTFAVAFVTWFLIGVAIIIVCIMFFTGAGEAEAAEGEAEAEESELSGNKKNSTLINIFFLVSFILVLVTGFLSMFSAISIRKSPNYSASISKLKTAYNNCIIAASFSLGSVGLLIIGFITQKVIENKRKQAKNPKKTPPKKYSDLKKKQEAEEEQENLLEEEQLHHEEQLREQQQEQRLRSASQQSMRSSIYSSGLSPIMSQTRF